MPFNHDDRKLLHSVSNRLDISLAELADIRESLASMVELMRALAEAEEKEENQLDRITGTLTSP